LVGLTKTYCNLNFSGGILWSSTCWNETKIWMQEMQNAL
jgi:hypothetical protein